MEELLCCLLNKLDEIGADYEELYDSECRERMSTAIMDGFIQKKSGFVLADDFGLHYVEANQAVRAALAEYITDANEKSAELGIIGFHERLAAFQNEGVKSDEEENFYDDFFGYWRPETFDPAGNVIGE